ncbi:hypothetical protein V6N11_037076 [Hibiscus sabdariffa]|uniref:Uncharacterized protein n=1 Tax=Hibiscus sabdariffa TaxID=183260 RepID=A0ABR2A9A2_9ROSI
MAHGVNDFHGSVESDKGASYTASPSEARINEETKAQGRSFTELTEVLGSGCQQPHKTEDLSGIEYRMTISLTGSTQSNVNEIAHGDCGSFAASPLSGPIPCSGSVSLRSSSSTGFTKQIAIGMEWQPSKNGGS